MHRSSATSPNALTLDAVIHQIEAAIASHDPRAAHTLLEQYVLEAWFGIGPSRFSQILTMLQARGIVPSPVLSALHALMMMTSGSEGGTDPGLGPDTSLPGDEPLPAEVPVHSPLGALTIDEDLDVARYIGDFGRMFALRLQGHPVEAFRARENLKQEFGVFQTLIASEGGWGLFTSLQDGLTAMLAGDFEVAEANLAEAQLHPVIPTLPFLTRDAHSKAALLHACFGDPAMARAELAVAEQQPRTSSWVEPVLDAQATIVRALIDAESAYEAIELFNSVQPSVLGEMWPFYAYAIHEVFVRAGQPDEAVRRLTVLDQTRLPRTDGEGFTGSVLPLLLSLSDLTAGKLVSAREYWQRVDPDLPLTGLISAMFAVSTGDNAEAIRITLALRSQTRALRQLELWRLSILATSLLLEGQEADCLEVLRTAQALPRGLSPIDARVFHTQVHEFATAQLSDWPRLTPQRMGAYSHVSLETGDPMTPRELDMLKALSRGLSRPQIAREMYLSLNTIKAHQQALYRKLGVTSKDAAVIAGEQRGLI